MKIVEDDVSLRDFKAWSGGKETLDKLIESGTVDKAQEEIEELFPDGITDTQLNDYLWFQIEDDHPEWFDDNKEEKEEVRRQVEETHHSDGPLGFRPLMESDDGTLYRLNYEDDDDDFTVFKLVAESQFVTNNMAGWSSDYEIDYDFSKSFEDNVQELKETMMADGVLPALGADFAEYVEDFPEWAITYCMYDDSSGMSDEDKKLVDDWMEENEYDHLSDVIEVTHTDFNPRPAFGPACETSTVVMAKQPKKEKTDE